MKISELEIKLAKFKQMHGDVDVKLVDDYSGHNIDPTSLMAMHPYTNPFGCMNFSEPVNAVRLSKQGKCATDEN